MSAMTNREKARMRLGGVLKFFKKSPEALLDTTRFDQARRDLATAYGLGWVKLSGARSRTSFQVPSLLKAVGRDPSIATVLNAEEGTSLSEDLRRLLRKTADEVVMRFREGDHGALQRLLRDVPGLILHTEFHPELVECLAEMFKENRVRLDDREYKTSLAHEFDTARQNLRALAIPDEICVEFLAVHKAVSSRLIEKTRSAKDLGATTCLRVAFRVWERPDWTENDDEHVKRAMEEKYRPSRWREQQPHRVVRKQTVDLLEQGRRKRGSILEEVACHGEKVESCCREYWPPGLVCLLEWLLCAEQTNELIREVLCRYSPGHSHVGSMLPWSERAQSAALDQWPSIKSQQNYEQHLAAVIELSRLLSESKEKKTGGVPAASVLTMLRAAECFLTNPGQKDPTAYDEELRGPWAEVVEKICGLLATPDESAWHGMGGASGRDALRRAAALAQARAEGHCPLPYAVGKQRSNDSKNG